MNAFNYTTHSKQVLGDLHTPVSIYLKVRDMYPQSALMESSDYHAGENSLSFIALCPLASIGINSGIVTTTYPDNTRREEPLSQSFRVEMRSTALSTGSMWKETTRNSAGYTATPRSMP